MLFRKSKDKFEKRSTTNPILLLFILIFLVVIATVLFYQTFWQSPDEGITEVRYLETGDQVESVPQVKVERRANYLAVQFKVETKEEKIKQIFKELDIEDFEKAFPDMEEFKEWYKVKVPLLTSAQSLANQFKTYEEIKFVEAIIE